MKKNTQHCFCPLADVRGAARPGKLYWSPWRLSCSACQKEGCSPGCSGQQPPAIKNSKAKMKNKHKIEIYPNTAKTLFRRVLSSEVHHRQRKVGISYCSKCENFSLPKYTLFLCQHVYFSGNEDIDIKSPTAMLCCTLWFLLGYHLYQMKGMIVKERLAFIQLLSISRVQPSFARLNTFNTSLRSCFIVLIIAKSITRGWKVHMKN